MYEIESALAFVRDHYAYSWRRNWPSSMAFIWNKSSCAASKERWQRVRITLPALPKITGCNTCYSYAVWCINYINLRRTNKSCSTWGKVPQDPGSPNRMHTQNWTHTLLLNLDALRERASKVSNNKETSAVGNLASLIWRFL